MDKDFSIFSILDKGAWDNAVGCSALVEIARAFRAAGVKPRRSILFPITTGEEDGFFGSGYFVWNPPFRSPPLPCRKQRRGAAGMDRG
jgi:Zn-dependent M28 family amino/carboxypeptidase